MCGTHGYILGYSGQDVADSRQTLMAFAKDCAEHGQPLPSTPVSLRPRVSSISEEVILRGPTGSTVASCNACQNCVKTDAVMSEWNWPLSLCKAKGTLIFQPASEHRGCEWASPGMPSDTLRDVDLRAEFQPGYVMDAGLALEAMVNNGNLNIDPEQYPTDDEVSPEDAADGIRAWRRLECPFGTGKVIHLPIFDRNHFTEEQQSRIPRTGDGHNPELYVDYSNLLWRFAVTTWQRDHTLLVQSLPGLGKTEFTYYLAWVMQLPWRRIFFTDSIEWDDVFGTLLLEDGETCWVDGEFTQGFQGPEIMCIDEPNLARSEIISTLRTTTEKVPTVHLNTSAKGKKNTVVKYGHKYNFRIWCANPAWDERNVGTKELAAADLSRLSPAVLEAPPKDIERHIIRTAVRELEGFDIPDKLLTELLKVSADFRELSEQREFPGTWGIRENIDVAGNLQWYPFEEAFRMTALNYFEPAVAKEIIEASIKTVHDGP